MSMTTLGERLQQRRKTHGTTLEEIAEKTRIPISCLLALEQNDFENLPGRVYTKLFIRAYAQVADFDPTDLIADYDSRHSQGEQDEPIESWHRERRNAWHRGSGHSGPGRTIIALAVVSIGVLGFAAWMSSPFFRREAPAAQAVQLLFHEPQNQEPLTSKEESGTIVSGDQRSNTRETAPPVERAPAPQNPVSDPIAHSGPETLVQVSPGRLTVTEVGVGRRVIALELESRGEVFEKGEVVWVGTRVVGGAIGQYVSHVWLHEGRTVQQIKLELGGPHWRTHSRKKLGVVGKWTVEARHPDGHVLARSAFTCVPENSQAQLSRTPG